MKAILKKAMGAQLFVLFLLFTSCEKFLDEKSDKTLAIPSRLQDLQALMDDIATIGIGVNEGEFSSGDFYLTAANWSSIQLESERRMYTWNPVIIHTDRGTSGWEKGYKAIYYCNTVLEGLKKIDRTAYNNAEWDHLQGQALYHRAQQLLEMSNVWSPAYDEATAGNDLGLPLRLTTDFNVVSTRSGVKDTYEQILKDLKGSLPLLPLQPVSAFRPSKTAAYALLARTFLTLHDYSNCFLYADSAIRLRPQILNYNTLSAGATYPITRTANSELICIRLFPAGSLLNLSYAKISPDLYNSYSSNDLRKTVFFRSNGDGSYRFKGSYYGSSSYFSGIATDEVYLMRAECLARTGKEAEAMDDLNTLLRNRYKTGTFVPFHANSADEALQLILMERRKELLMRGIRWMDLKRLNKEGAGITLEREINGTKYSLLPNDLRYALPIPESVILISGIPQNPR